MENISHYTRLAKKLFARLNICFHYFALEEINIIKADVNEMKVSLHGMRVPLNCSCGYIYNSGYTIRYADRILELSERLDTDKFRRAFANLMNDSLDYRRKSMHFLKHRPVNYDSVTIMTRSDT